MPRDDRPRRRPRDDDDYDRPAKAADPERLYLMIGGGAAVVLVLAGVVFFATRSSRKADDAQKEADRAAAEFARDFGKLTEQNADTVVLSNFRRTAAGAKPDGPGTLKVDYAFAGWPAGDRGKYYLVIETRKETKELSLGELTKTDAIELDGTGPVFRLPAKVWMVFKANGASGPGTVVSNVLTADAPAAGKPEDR